MTAVVVVCCGAVVEVVEVVEEDDVVDEAVVVVVEGAVFVFLVVVVGAELPFADPQLAKTTAKEAVTTAIWTLDLIIGLCPFSACNLPGSRGRYGRGNVEQLHNLVYV